MKKQTFELNKMGLTAMSEKEMEGVDGGGFWSWVGAAIGAVIGFIGGGPLGALAGAALGFGLGCVADFASADEDYCYKYNQATGQWSQVPCP